MFGFSFGSDFIFNSWNQILPCQMKIKGWQIFICPSFNVSKYNSGFINQLVSNYFLHANVGVTTLSSPAFVLFHSFRDMSRSENKLSPCISWIYVEFTDSKFWKLHTPMVFSNSKKIYTSFPSFYTYWYTWLRVDIFKTRKIKIKIIKKTVIPPSIWKFIFQNFLPVLWTLLIWKWENLLLLVDFLFRITMFL